MKKIDLLIRLLEEINQKLNVDNILKDLAGNTAKKYLRQYHLMNDRWNNLLQKRSSIASELTYKFIREFEKKDTNFELDQFKYLKTLNIKPNSNKIIDDFGVYKGASTRQLANIF